MLNEEECYQEIKFSIRKGHLMPKERLVESDLAEKFGAGRAAVRAALARLEQEGLVEREKHRGARVRFITEKDAVQIIEVRCALEPVIAYHAALNSTKEDIDFLNTIIAEMQECKNTDDLLTYSDANEKLHRYLIKIANHEVAGRILDTLHSQIVRFQYSTILSRGRPESSLEEHQAIVHAVSQHNPEKAEQEMRDHLSRVLDTIRSFQKQDQKAFQAF